MGLIFELKSFINLSYIVLIFSDTISFLLNVEFFNMFKECL